MAPNRTSVIGQGGRRTTLTGRAATGAARRSSSPTRTQQIAPVHGAPFSRKNNPGRRSPSPPLTGKANAAALGEERSNTLNPSNRVPGARRVSREGPAVHRGNFEESTAADWNGLQGYTIEELLGAGAFGEVRKAIKQDTGDVVAIKLMAKKKMRSEEIHAIRAEAEILAKLDHPNITSFVGYEEDFEHIFIIMEYVKGGELLFKIEETGTFSELDAAKLARNILKGVAYMHDQGVVHRDLKPENILLKDPSDLQSIRIADFGLSKETEGHEGLHKAVGTIAYMAPELFNNRLYYTAEVDVWAVGCIIFILVTGFHPFYEAGIDLPEVTKRIKGGVTHDVIPSSVSGDAADLLKRLLEVDPHARYTAKEALSHPWITGCSNSDAMPTVIELMRAFNAERRLKKAGHAVMATQFFKSGARRSSHERVHASSSSASKISPRSFGSTSTTTSTTSRTLSSGQYNTTTVKALATRMGASDAVPSPTSNGTIIRTASSRSLRSKPKPASLGRTMMGRGSSVRLDTTNPLMMSGTSMMTAKTPGSRGTGGVSPVDNISISSGSFQMVHSGKESSKSLVSSKDRVIPGHTKRPQPPTLPTVEESPRSPGVQKGKATPSPGTFKPPTLKPLAKPKPAGIGHLSTAHKSNVKPQQRKAAAIATRSRKSSLQVGAKKAANRA